MDDSESMKAVPPLLTMFPADAGAFADGPPPPRGMGHEEKRMKFENAWTITTGLSTLEPIGT